MEIQGRVSYVGPTESGTSQKTGNAWRTQEFVVEYFEHDTDRYPDSVALKLINEKIDEMNLHVGDRVGVGLMHQTRQYNGNFYNEVRHFRINKLAGATSDKAPVDYAAAPPKSEQLPAGPALPGQDAGGVPGGGFGDNLPF